MTAYPRWRVIPSAASRCVALRKRCDSEESQWLATHGPASDGCFAPAVAKAMAGRQDDMIRNWPALSNREP